MAENTRQLKVSGIRKEIAGNWVTIEAEELEANDLVEVGIGPIASDLHRSRAAVTGQYEGVQNNESVGVR